MFELSVNRPTWAQIDLDRLASNFHSLRDFFGHDVEIMAVVKANAYGHGAVECAKRLAVEGVSWFAVATAEEAVELRQADVASRILVVGGFYPGQEREFLNFDLTPIVFSIDQAQALNAEAAKHGTVAKIHFKADTGMNRVGFRREEWNGAASALAEMKNLEVEGLMTHFPSAEKVSENTFTENQVAEFAEAIQIFHDAGHRPGIVDMANSPGAVMHPLARSKMVRIGGLLFGLAEDVIPECTKAPEVKPVMALYSRIAMIKKVPAGETIGYGRTFATERDALIATIPIGYHDGYRRGLSNKFHAIVNGRRAKIVGRISMDWTTLDVTDSGVVKTGDAVTLIGNDGSERVAAKDLAVVCDTISYEITCGIGSRVPRIYT